ncbi:MAG: formate/nitrite transporter family protein [Clostridia bacterium]|nr:formate/nitrite transporter family protein [Clostridia bacterium]
MKKIVVFVNAVLAGICISLGGIAFLSIENKVVGALFFTLGLFTIVTMKFNLFTGKVAYVFDNKPSYIIDVLIIWLGNFVGTFLTAAAVNLTRIADIGARAASMCETKLNDSPLSVFILAVFCNVMIFIAVDGFAGNPHQVGKYLSLFFGVAGFIVCGYEHCVANMFYISVANMWSAKAFLYLLIMTLGNTVGAWIIPLSRKFTEKYTKKD